MHQVKLHLPTSQEIKLSLQFSG